MKILKNKEGFTLVETLIAINIAFLVLTFLITFYIFINKFVFSTVKNIETKSEVSFTLNSLIDFLDKSEGFWIFTAGDTLGIRDTDSNRIDFIYDKVCLKGIRFLDNIDEASIDIITRTGIEIVWNNKTKADTVMKEIDSRLIKSIYFRLRKDDHNYETKYFQNDISQKRFINI